MLQSNTSKICQLQALHNLLYHFIDFLTRLGANTRKYPRTNISTTLEKCTRNRRRIVTSIGYPVHESLRALSLRSALAAEASNTRRYAIRIYIQRCGFDVFAGLVPERPRKMAAHGAEAGGEVGQMRRQRGRRFPWRPWALWEQHRKRWTADESSIHAGRTAQSSVLGVLGLRVISEIPFPGQASRTIRKTPVVNVVENSRVRRHATKRGTVLFDYVNPRLSLSLRTREQRHCE